MTNETRSRIRAYTEELPHMKEKVFGALLMLVIAAMVMVTSSYAWVTLSRSPEVSDIKTTLAANGALEIALAKKDGSQPDEFDIDESLTYSNDVTVTNLQWGNLVNLSDASYGIENMALRPAQLNTSNLKRNPLMAADYGEDGRVVELGTNYQYAKYEYNKDAPENSQFVTLKTGESGYGVRAIVSFKEEITNAEQLKYTEKKTNAYNKHDDVNDEYVNVGQNFSSLSAMISVFASDILNDTNSDMSEYISDMIPLYQAVYDAMEVQKDAYVALANYQYFPEANKTGETTEKTWDDFVQHCDDYTTEEVYDDSGEPIKSENGIISLPGLKIFIADFALIQEDLAHLQAYKASGQTGYYWNGYYTDADGVRQKDNSTDGFTLSKIVADLIEWSSMGLDLDGSGPPGTPVTSLNVSEIANNMGILTRTNDVYVNGGILYRFEQSCIDEASRIGSDRNLAECNIDVVYNGLPVTVKGRASASLDDPSYVLQSLSASENTDLTPTSGVAEDTYGLAVDLWVRTNVESTHLILEGAIAVNENGEEVVYTYNGVNRIWGKTGEKVLKNYTKSTTQGGGSCYVYYADSPEDMARSLELLKFMKVAFVDSDGKKLAIAEMDTANYLAVNGRVTVPLVLSYDSQNYTYTDIAEGEMIGRAITTLYADTPVLVTAIVYLEGADLSNEHVLAASEIQGSLNIQFGSSNDLQTLGSNDLKNDTRTVSAWLDVDDQQKSELVLDYDNATTDAQLTTTIMLEVDGVQPTEVTAFFVRALNETQGTREATMTFTKPGDNWLCTHQFDAPGVYYLRYVRLDGVDYALETPLKVEVKGFKLASVTMSHANSPVETVYTSDDSYPVTVSAQFASNDVTKLPYAVEVRLMRDGNSQSVPLKYNGSTGYWTGTTNLTISGEYTMEYMVYTIREEDPDTGAVVLNEYYKYLVEGEKDFTQTLKLAMGLRVTVTDAEDPERTLFDDIKYDPDAIAADAYLYYRDVCVEVYDNDNNLINELTGLILYYSNGSYGSNSKSANLTWSAEDECYTGTLPLDRPGSYQFYKVEMGSNTIRKYNQYPLYIIRSPYAPEYDVTSTNTANNAKGVQAVAYANDAVIDGINILYSSSATVSFVVYNDNTEQYYVCPTTDTVEGMAKNGMVAHSGDKWTVTLPVYTTDGVQTQAGTWSVAAILVSDCFDESGELRKASNPIVWVNSDSSISQKYLTESKYSADARIDFSSLTTTVSNEVKVTMDDVDTTAFGGPDAEFLSVFSTDVLSDSSKGYFTKVNITDGDGNVITGGRVRSVKMTVKYDYTTSEEYGYAVASAVKDQSEYSFVFKYDANEGGYVIDINESWYNWQFVGEYHVDALTVTFDDGTTDGKKMVYSYTTDTSSNKYANLPEMYTVETEGPDETAVSVNVVSPKELGKGTGTFLEEYTLGSYFSATVSLKSSEAAWFVDTSKLLATENPVQLVLTYDEGTKSAPNGGYTWTGDSDYESFSLIMTANESGVYKPTETTPLLAGTYTGAVNVTLANGDVKTEPLQYETFEVYSGLPDVKITAVSPDITEKVLVNTNADPTTNHLTAGVETFEAKNQFGNYWAVVYMAYAKGATGKEHQEECDLSKTDAVGASYYNYANYTQPGIKFKLNNGGTGTADIQVGAVTAELTNDVESEFVLIGTIDDSGKTSTMDSHVGVDYIVYQTTCYYIYTYDKATLLDGDPATPEPDPVIIETVTSTVTNNAGSEVIYTRTLQNSITISQPNKQNPTLTWNVGDGFTIEVTHDGEAYNGADISFATELTATITADFGYHDPEIDVPAGVVDWQEAVDLRTETVRVYTFRLMGDATLTGSATKYPTITFKETSGVVDVTVDVTVDGVTEPNVASGTGIKPEAVVAVTVTTNRTNGYCLPKLDLSKCTGITEWAATPSEGNFVSTYTFKMPAVDVSLADPTTTGTYTIAWENSGTRTFKVVDSADQMFATGPVNVVPEDTVRIILTAVGGKNPVLTAPANVTGGTHGTDESGNEFVSYTYQVNGDLKLDGKVDPYPVVKLDNVYASIEVFVGADDKNYPNGEGTGIGIRKNSTVTVKLTAKDGWYAPQMSQPTYMNENGETEAVSDWRVVGTLDRTATYEFTMPDADVDATQKFTASGYKVTYNFNDGSGRTTSETYAGTELELPTATRTGYAFNGWYTAASNGSKVGTVGDNYIPTANITLYAQWKAYTVIYDYATNGGSGSPASETYSDSELILPTPDPRTGYTFNGWYTAASGGTKKGDADTSYIPDADITLYAQWTKIPYTITVSTENAKVSGVTNGQTAYYDDTVSITVSFTESGSPTLTVTDGNGKTLLNESTAGTYTFSMPASNVTISASSEWSCVTPETLITLADGTQKMIKDIKGDEMLLVWNHYTGKLDVAPVHSIINHNGITDEVYVSTLEFSDGSYVEIITEHVFFDYDLNCYVAIRPENIHDYVGHKFAKLAADGSDLERVELVGYKDEVRITEAYEITSKEHSVCFTNGLLSASAHYALVLNCYDFNGENLMFYEEQMKADVETYGLYTYEDFAEYFTEEMFYAFDLGKLKISVGKGYGTWDDVVKLCQLAMKYAIGASL